MSKKRQTLVIDRKVWLRGQAGSRLLANDGRRCCVGIYLQSCGVPDERMLNVLAVDYLVRLRGLETIPDAARWLINKEGQDVARMTHLYPANDQEMDEGEREAVIAEKFAQQGVDVTFIN